MVSTIRFRSVKAIDVGWRRSYFVLFLPRAGAGRALALVALPLASALWRCSYGYTACGLPADHVADRQLHRDLGSIHESQATHGSRASSDRLLAMIS